ncbi:MAG: hypothetical protein H6Q90_3852 [Deltaproteobacteria bacterium]|nr:hypothetical protein [Deltaproteobacteria bacterium]
MRRILASLLLIGATLVAAPGTGLARSEKILAYPRDSAWSTAVRFIVVDEHAKILEKDAEAGYVLFELRDDGKVYRGSLEVMTLSLDGQTTVRFVINLVDRPSWMEIGMLTRLQQKLRAELGSPTPPPTPRPNEPRKDAPKDKDGKDEPRKDAPKDQPEPPLSRAP